MNKTIENPRSLALKAPSVFRNSGHRLNFLKGLSKISLFLQQSVSFVNSLIFLGLLILIGHLLLLGFQPTENRGSAFNAGPKPIKEASELNEAHFSILWPKDIPINLSHLGGLSEVKAEMSDLIDYLKHPASYLKLGAHPPKGILLFGPPGTGKTMLVRAFAKEANLPLLVTSGSDFSNAWVGGTSEKIRSLFKKARQQAPCIVFIDEIDAIARRRNNPNTNAEYDNALNQFLTEVDGLLVQNNEARSDHTQRILLIAATNNYQALDPAVIRSGRFDKHLYFSLPSLEEREAILQILLSIKPTAKDVDLVELAQSTFGFSAADLDNLINQAAFIAARNNQSKLDASILMQAKEKLMFGEEEKGLHLTSKEKKIIAFHEAGHALVAHYLKTNRIEKITIVPRKKGSLGFTAFANEEKQLFQKNELEHRIAVALGGRIGEQILLGQGLVTTGAADDLKVATDLAYNMVAVYGFSDLGPIDFTSSTNVTVIEQEMFKIIKRNEKLALGILEKNKATLFVLAEKLLEKETLNQGEFMQIIHHHSKPLQSKSPGTETFCQGPWYKLPDTCPASM